MLSYSSELWWGFGLFDAQWDLATCEGGNLKHDLTNAGTKIDEFIFLRDRVKLVHDLAN